MFDWKNTQNMFFYTILQKKIWTKFCVIENFYINKKRIFFTFRNIFIDFKFLKAGFFVGSNNEDPKTTIFSVLTLFWIIWIFYVLILRSTGNFKKWEMRTIKM